MFQNKGYATRGYLGADPCIQAMVDRLLWKRIQKGVNMDYLQVFKFRREKGVGIEVTHYQESPEIEERYMFFLDPDEVELPEENVWVIDDGTHHTFLLPSEY